MQLFSMKSPGQLIAVTILATVTVLIAACGTGSGGAAPGDAEDAVGIRRIDPGRVLTFDDFMAVGFKKSKSYDVTELSGAEAAYYGFWGLDPYKREDYEVRFYASQAEAIELGTELADQRTWPDALLTQDTAVWKVGIKDARKCEGVLGQSQWAATCTIPKYYDYMFVGNAILFCPGAAVDVAQENCDELLAQMQ